MLGADPTHAVVVEQLDRHVGQRDEVAVGRVEQVRDAAAVAVGGQRQRPGDPVPGGLDQDTLLTLLHDIVRVGTRACDLESCMNYPGRPMERRGLLLALALLVVLVLAAPAPAAVRNYTVRSQAF